MHWKSAKMSNDKFQVCKVLSYHSFQIIHLQLDIKCNIAMYVDDTTLFSNCDGILSAATTRIGI